MSQNSSLKAGEWETGDLSFDVSRHVTGANGGKSKPASAVDRLRKVHVAIMADDTELVCGATFSDCCQQKNLTQRHMWLICHLKGLVTSEILAN